MATRRQNLVLFYNGIETKGDISNDLVRLAMNYFVIDENEETEINAVYYVHEKAGYPEIAELRANLWRNYPDLKIIEERTFRHADRIPKDNMRQSVEKAVQISKKLQTENSVTHFLCGLRCVSVSTVFAKIEDEERLMIDYESILTGEKISNSNIHKLARFYWIQYPRKFQDTYEENLICTCLIGSDDSLNPKTELSRYINNTNLRCSVGNDIDTFSQKLFRGDFHCPMKEFKLLFLSKKQITNDKIMNFGCSRNSSIETIKFEKFHQKELDYTTLIFSILIMIISFSFHYFIGLTYEIASWIEFSICVIICTIIFTLYLQVSTGVFQQ